MRLEFQAALDAADLFPDQFQLCRYLRDLGFVDLFPDDPLLGSPEIFEPFTDPFKLGFSAPEK